MAGSHCPGLPSPQYPASLMQSRSPGAVLLAEDYPLPTLLCPVGHILQPIRGHEARPIYCTHLLRENNSDGSDTLSLWCNGTAQHTAKILWK